MQPTNRVGYRTTDVCACRTCARRHLERGKTPGPRRSARPGAWGRQPFISACAQPRDHAARRGSSWAAQRHGMQRLRRVRSPTGSGMCPQRCGALSGARRSRSARARRGRHGAFGRRDLDWRGPIRLPCSTLTSSRVGREVWARVSSISLLVATGSVFRAGGAGLPPSAIAGVETNSRHEAGYRIRAAGREAPTIASATEGKSEIRRVYVRPQWSVVEQA